MSPHIRQSIGNRIEDNLAVGTVLYSAESLAIRILHLECKIIRTQGSAGQGLGSLKLCAACSFVLVLKVQLGIIIAGGLNTQRAVTIVGNNNSNRVSFGIYGDTVNVSFSLADEINMLTHVSRRVFNLRIIDFTGAVILNGPLIIRAILSDFEGKHIVCRHVTTINGFGTGKLHRTGFRRISDNLFHIAASRNNCNFHACSSFQSAQLIIGNRFSVRKHHIAPLPWNSIQSVATRRRFFAECINLYTIQHLFEFNNTVFVSK